MRISIDVSEDVIRQAKKMANEEKVSEQDILANALSDYFRVFGQRDRPSPEQARQTFLDVMSRVPDVEPEEYDRVPPELSPDIERVLERTKNRK